MSVLDSIPPTHASVELLEAMAGIWRSAHMRLWFRAACGDPKADRLAFAYSGTEAFLDDARPEHKREVTCVNCLLAMRNIGRGLAA